MDSFDSDEEENVILPPAPGYPNTSSPPSAGMDSFDSGEEENVVIARSTVFPNTLNPASPAFQLPQPFISAPTHHIPLPQPPIFNAQNLSNAPTLFSSTRTTNSYQSSPSLFNNPPPPQFHVQSNRYQLNLYSEVYSSSLKLDNDEEFVLKPVEEIKEISSEPVSIKISPMHSKLKIGTSEVDLVCSLTLLGLSAELEVIEKNREGLDLVFVVDISGSMGSGKIDLVKVTIEFVLTLLKDYDRVCIIGFSDNAFIYCPMTVMNEVGKLKVGNIVQCLKPSGGTNIESGVRAALHLLADRKLVNQLTAIMLLSDGVDNNTQSVNNRIRDAIDEFKPRINSSFKMHTFGYGADHDSAIMNLMAELTRGNFYYIENVTSVTDAFSNCMGELVSLVANKIRASLTTLPCEVPFKLSKVFSSNEDTSFDMPDLFFDDQQDAVFILKFEPSEVQMTGKISPIKALVSYTLKGGSQVSKEVFLEIELAGEDEEVGVNKDVQLEYYRVRGAETLKKVAKKADGGLMEEARKIGNEFQVELEGCSVRENPKMQYLLKDIVDAQVRTQNVNSWNSGGRAQVISVSNTHSNKTSSNNCVSYQKPMQAMYSVSSNIYAKSLPVQSIVRNISNSGMGFGYQTNPNQPLPYPSPNSSGPQLQQPNLPPSFGYPPNPSTQPFPANFPGPQTQQLYPPPQQMPFMNPPQGINPRYNSAPSSQSLNQVAPDPFLINNLAANLNPASVPLPPTHPKK